jgi:soluble lytic murein transglycosylase-like protein
MAGAAGQALSRRGRTWGADPAARTARVSAQKILTMLWVLAIVMPAAPAAANPSGCDSTVQSLAPAQRAKFRLTAEPCRAPSPGEASLDRDRPVPADAVVATRAQADPAGRAIAERESRHLQLFDAAGTVTVLGQPVPLATPAAVRAEDARSQPAARDGKSKPTAKPTASAMRALRLASDVDVVARRHDIDPLLLHAIAHVESRHNVAAHSPAGARGVMQVMPATAKRFGVDTVQALLEPRTNLDVGASYLKTLQRRFGNNLTLVLAAYNAGEGAVERYGRRVPPYAETQGYVRQVLEHYRTLTAASQRSAPL